MSIFLEVVSKKGLFIKVNVHENSRFSTKLMLAAYTCIRKLGKN